jgi:hypothetical protein
MKAPIGYRRELEPLSVIDACGRAWPMIKSTYHRSDKFPHVLFERQSRLESLMLPIIAALRRFERRMLLIVVIGSQTT